MGWAVDRLLIYGKGGFAFADLDISVVDSCTTGGCGPATINASDDGVEFGWTAGVGAEWAFADRWSAKLEYLFMSFDDIDASGTSFIFPFTWDHDVDLHTIKVGVNFHF